MWQLREMCGTSGLSLCPSVEYFAPTHNSDFTENPQTFSRSVGTYLCSLFLRTHSLSTPEPSYSPGESPIVFTISSNEVATGTVRMSGLPQLGFPRLLLKGYLISVTTSSPKWRRLTLFPLTSSHIRGTAQVST